VGLSEFRWAGAGLKGEGGAFDDSASNSRQLYRTRRVAGTRLARGRKFPNIPELAVYVVVGPLTLDRGHVRKKKGGEGEGEEGRIRTEEQVVVIGAVARKDEV
jgi:hypothetical protein